MKSTSASKEALVRVENLGLTFSTNIYQGKTFRDQFVDFFKDPISTFKVEKDRVVLFTNLSFEIYQGDRVGLLGLNGVGKTSLCRVLSGHYAVQRGRVDVFGKVKAIFDTSVGIYPELTGRENARLLGTLLYPEKIDHIDELVQEALDFSELREFLDAPYRIYSNGMQARLCLSLISCLPSDILILDEVFDGADRLFREKISKRIFDMIQNSGAVIFVSHSPDQVEKVCNRAIVLHQGKIAFDGSPKDANRFYDQLPVPEDRFKRG